MFIKLRRKNVYGLVRDLNPGPLAPKARIIPLDQRATTTFYLYCTVHVHAYIDRLFISRSQQNEFLFISRGMKA